jgi:hypothetical protein
MDYQKQKRDQPADDGLRLQGPTYIGHFNDLPPVLDGILGDGMMRARTKGKTRMKVSRANVLCDQLTIPELNDLNDQLAWNTYDVAVMRANESGTGMSPRQESTT